MLNKMPDKSFRLYFPIIILFSCLTLQSCYTQISLQKHSIQSAIADKDRIVNFNYAVVDTFDNDWLPDEGDYYLFRFDLKNINEDKIDRFLNTLYAKGYNITGAWYRPSITDCEESQSVSHPFRKTLAPVFVLLLSDFDDSIIQYNFYAVMNKPYIPCPFGVWEFYISQ